MSYAADLNFSDNWDALSRYEKAALLFIGGGHDVTDQLQAERDRLDFERL